MPIKFSELEKLPHGAQFYTADLHIHSHGGSHDVKDTTMTPEAIVDEAVKLGLGIIAITDHNGIRNTERSIEYAKKHAGQLLVLAGVEVTTANGHLLVYFGPEAFDDLSSFIGKLDIVKGKTSESHTAMSMSDVATAAHIAGGLCIAAHIDRKNTGFETLDAGYKNWKKDIIANPGIVGLEVDDAANLTWYSPDEGGPAPASERRRLVEQRANAPGAAARAVLAHFQNSDAHSLKAFAERAQNRALTRLKMDALTFESFRTAVADPEARVRATVRLPPAVPRVIGMHVDGGFLHAQSLRFSDNLTCFIGGRGTGKTTALKCIAYALGASDEIAEYNNCPDTVVVFCRDAHDNVYRYERMKGDAEPSVLTSEKGKAVEAPKDVFRVEYYGQGHLAEVAEDPLTRPDLLQEFLDRHTRQDGFADREADLVSQLDKNGAQLVPLEAQEAGRAAKKAELDACDAKLKLAEDGHLKEIAAQKAAIGAEKSLAKTLNQIKTGYQQGISLNEFLRDYDAVLQGAGTITSETSSLKHLAAIKKVVEDTNAELRKQESQIQEILTGAARKLDTELKALGAVHRTLDQTVAQKIAELQKNGLSASVADHQKVVARRGTLANDLATLDQRKPQLEKHRKVRAQLQTDLAKVREEWSRTRRDRVAEINNYLAKTIDDYTVAIVYEDAGLVDSFMSFMKSVMHGTWFQDESTRRLCEAVTPQELAMLVRAGDAAAFAKGTGLDATWSPKVMEKLSPLETLHRLDVLPKPPRPTIKVLTKGAKTRQIPVKQLSDGQKHTILLTIAMLAESEVPLVIDQPEDDLDNAFIFSSVVRMLRSVKECRQVILVTHNANIAVLGDAELLFPMRRSGDHGTTFDAGSVDKADTKAAVQSILEGGKIAFLRRKEIYGH